MSVNRGLRLIAGIVIIISLLLAKKKKKNWLWFTAFIGANLIQSAFTNWCPAMVILRKMGLKDD